MTRINAGIPVETLSDKHLLAEHREIKRIPNMVRSGRANLNDIPKEFTLGKGHVRFFYDKILYLLVRYKQIHKECIRRGFNVTDFTSAFTGKFPKGTGNMWHPKPKDIEMVQQRISEKLNGKI